MHPDAACTQYLVRMPHGGDEQHDPRLVAPHVLGTGARFGHPDGIRGRIDIRQGRRVGAQLVAGDQEPGILASAQVRSCRASLLPSFPVAAFTRVLSRMKPGRPRLS